MKIKFRSSEKSKSLENNSKKAEEEDKVNCPEIWEDDQNSPIVRDGLSPEEFHANLRENGRKKLIDFSVNDQADRRPDWLDEPRFRAAREAIKKYQLGIEFSSLTGLFLILQCPDALEPLLSTGNSKDIPSLFTRYLDTVLHVRKWYDYDIFNPETKGYRSIRLVRGMHKRLQQIMNDKFNVSDVQGKPTLWMTQYEVSVTQFSFIGMALAYPTKCGLISAKREELEAINYYWRVLGYMMGVEDEFNCCHFDKLEDIQAFMKLILEKELKPRLNSEPCPTGTAMCQGICIALSDFITMVTFNSLAHWWSKLFMFNGYELKPLTFKEKCLTNLSKLSFYKMFKNDGFLKASTKLHMLRFERKLKNREKIYKRLVNKYSDKKEYIFLSDRVDYLGLEKEKSASQEADAAGEIAQTLDDKENPAKCPFGFASSKLKLNPMKVESEPLDSYLANNNIQQVVAIEAS